MKKFDFKKIGMRIAGVSAGAVGGELLNKAHVIGNLSPTLRGGIKIVAGAVLPELMPKQVFLGHIGDGLIAAGAIDTYNGLTSPPVEGLEGIGDKFDDKFVVDNDYDVQGFDDDPINGVDQENPMGGIGDYAEDDEENM